MVAVVLAALLLAAAHARPVAAPPLALVPVLQTLEPVPQTLVPVPQTLAVALSVPVAALPVPVAALPALCLDAAAPPLLDPLSVAAALNVAAALSLAQIRKATSRWLTVTMTVTQWMIVRTVVIRTIAAQDPYRDPARPALDLVAR